MDCVTSMTYLQYMRQVRANYYTVRTTYSEARTSAVSYYVIQEGWIWGYQDGYYEEDRFVPCDAVSFVVVIRSRKPYHLHLQGGTVSEAKN
jgi:hypothetical protein